ncbi:1-acyl-sn-glycerol-3-phosphate acyltransferase [[Candida] railenensis]|uniref:1-acyl-sn-glycerol-3-phosphate acyltransferase n=1 Tax=[Candida] railenensis TaxID=45579 RepID=A0A9P0QRL0_9ASCO|nr:1-acyl-sn-glycerol-3-phosphate acyltransferase [[Candida] railenensis]
MFKSLKFFVRSVIYGSLITGCALYGVVASIILRIIGKKEYAQYTVAKAFYSTFSTATGIKIKLVNEEILTQLPAVIISNHQSALDILILAKVFQPGYTVTAKKVLQYFPFLGWFMLASGTFFLDRAKGEKARKVLERALAGLKKEKRGLFMFPEGTRSGFTTLELLPFKKGAFHLAKQAGIPVIPVVVSNTSTIFNAKKKVFESGLITIEVLDPMPTTGLETNEDVTRFSEEVHKKMSDVVKRLGYSVPSNQANSELQSQDAEINAEDATDINTDSEAEVEVVTEVVSEVTPLKSKAT